MAVIPENQKSSEHRPGSLNRVVWVGLLVGFLLNLTGWLGNNLLLAGMWQEVRTVVPESSWHASIWKDVFSLVPDFVYGMAIAWWCHYLNARSQSPVFLNSLKVGVWISLVGGVTTYFALANAGFIPWQLAFASFALVLATKLPLALWAGRLLARE